MMSNFENNLRFALRKEALELRKQLPLNKIEKLGDKLSWFAYDFKDYYLNAVLNPLFIIVLFTAVAMIIAALIFYPFDTWNILSTFSQWIVDSINWNYVRFSFWILSEITIFGIGMRAFGRFTNQQLLKHYNNQNMAA